VIFHNYYKTGEFKMSNVPQDLEFLVSCVESDLRDSPRMAPGMVGSREDSEAISGRLFTLLKRSEDERTKGIETAIDYLRNLSDITVFSQEDLS